MWSYSASLVYNKTTPHFEEKIRPVFACNSEQHRTGMQGCFVSVGPFRPDFLIFCSKRFKIFPPSL